MRPVNIRLIENIFEQFIGLISRYYNSQYFFFRLFTHAPMCLESRFSHPPCVVNVCLNDAFLIF